MSDEQLSAYADGRLAGQDRARLELHVQDCAACRQAIAELGELRGALAGLPRAKAPRSFALRAADVEAATPARSGQGFAAAMPALSGVTMAAFVVFGVLVGVDMSGSADDTSSDGATGFVIPNALAPEAERGGAHDDLAGAEEGETAYEAADGDAAFATVTARAPTLSGAFGSVTPPADASPAATPEPEAAQDDGGDSASVALRGAQIATAAVGLVAAGSLAFAWWRRRI